MAVKGLFLLAAILINLHLSLAIRIASDADAAGQRLFFAPAESKLEFYNALTHPEAPPAPVDEQPEPENPITPRVPTELGVQLENVHSSQFYRYPNPTTTPRPGSFRSRVYVPPGLPNAYSRTPPQSQDNVVPFFTAPDGSLVPGISEIDHVVATNRIQQQAQRRAQQDAYQNQVLQQVQQDALNAIRESVSLITTNPGARRRPNTVIRPQQLSAPQPNFAQIHPGQTQAIFPGQPFLQQQQPQQPYQQTIFPAAPTPPSYPAIPAIPTAPQIPQIPAIPAVPSYPVFQQQPQTFLHPPAEAVHTLQHHPAPPTGVSYSRTYHVSLKRPQQHL